MAAITAVPALDHRRAPARSTTRAGARETTPVWGRLADGSARAVARPVSPTVYRRRRLVAALALATVAFVAGVILSVTLLSSPAGGSLTDEAREAERTHYVVQPGDTLWAVAGRVAPGRDPRQVVDALAAERGSTTVLPGETISWPLH